MREIGPARAFFGAGQQMVLPAAKKAIKNESSSEIRVRLRPQNPRR